MSGGQVKMANKKFTTIPHNFCITFNEETKVSEVTNFRPTDFSGQGFNFKTLSEVQDLVGLTMLDLIAIVHETQPVG